MRLIVCLAFAGLIVQAPTPAFSAEPDAPATLIAPTDALRLSVQERLSAKFTGASATRIEHQGALVEYYSLPENRLLWVDEAGLNERANAVIEEIAKAEDYGLRAADYQLPKLEEATSDSSWLADAEIMIGLAVLAYARDARGGRINPSRLTAYFDPKLVLPDPLQVIESIAFRSNPAAYLRSFHPDQPQFEALRQALIAARGGKADEQAVQIPDGPTLKLGIENEQVVLLRKRLEVPAREPRKEILFDEAVAEAVIRFQQSRGTVADGMVGPGTRRLLNGQSKQAAGPARVKQILLNMERWRWHPHRFSSFYVTVNVPEFMLRVVREDKPVFTTRVVVGKTNTQTPIFSEEMQTVVFNPYWNMPNSIKTQEIRPFIREEVGFFFGGGWNTGVLERHGLRIKVGGREVDPSRLDWNSIDIRSLNIYQPPGPGNVLGTVKFLFPNKHDVYMHDTPQKHLFAKPVRAESHGCMRVQNPDQFALTLLSIDQGWTAGRVASAIKNGYDHAIPLRQKIPVHVTYFTLRANEDGSLSTFPDLYGHDARMAAALKL